MAVTQLLVATMVLLMVSGCSALTNLEGASANVTLEANVTLDANLNGIRIVSFAQTEQLQDNGGGRKYIVAIMLLLQAIVAFGIFMALSARRRGREEKEDHRRIKMKKDDLEEEKSNLKKKNHDEEKGKKGLNKELNTQPHKEENIPAPKGHPLDEPDFNFGHVQVYREGRYLKVKDLSDLEKDDFDAGPAE